MPGMPWIMIQDVYYALPARKTLVTSDKVLHYSNDETGWLLFNGGAVPTDVEATAKFIKCTSSNANIICKPACKL